MNNIPTSIADRLDVLDEQLQALRAEYTESNVQADQATNGVDLASNPEVARAAEAFARAVGRAYGIDMPLTGAAGFLPVMEVPAEFAAQGGIGLGVMLARPR